MPPLAVYPLTMTEVIFNRIAPVVTAHNLDAALARYRRLGFATDLDGPCGVPILTRHAATT